MLSLINNDDIIHKEIGVMKIILTIINGFGIGELNDSALYGDEGANSYQSIKDADLSVLRLLGLDNIFNVGYCETKTPQGTYARMRSFSIGKDPYIQYRELLGNINYDKLNTENSILPLESDNLIKRLTNNGIKTKVFGNAVIYIGCDRVDSSADTFLYDNDEVVCEEAIKNLMTDMDDALYIISFDEAAKAGKMRDVKAYKEAMERIDMHVGHLIDAMFDDDIIIICSDNGCDSGLEAHSGYTREYVPLLISGRMISKNNDIKTVHGYDTLAHTILDFFGVLTAQKSIKQTIIALENQPQLLSRIKKLIKSSRKSEKSDQNSLENE